MAINPPNPGTFQQSLSQAAVNLRNDFQAIVFLNNYINACGGATFLETTIGLSTADAGVVVSTMANLATLANVYMGTATQQTTFSYMGNSELLWGGQ
jgi:hypothetical protein